MVHSKLEPERKLLSTVKRNVLVGKICLFCVGLSFFHVILDASQGLYDSVIIDLLFAIIVGFAWLLNRWKYHRTSKIFVFFTLNLLFAFFVSVLPQEIGTYLYYFPLIVASSALFDSEEKIYRNAFNALPILLLGLLCFSDFDVIKSLKFESPENANAFFAANAFSSAGIYAPNLRILN